MSNNNLDAQAIKNSLAKIYLNDLNKNIIDANLISAISIKSETVTLIIEFSEEMVIDQRDITEKVELLIKKDFPELKEVKIIFSSKKLNPKIKSASKVKHNMPNIDKIILLASAKGGVGKSTTAANLALALSEKGYSVGLVDADIYGPTIPKILGVNEQPKTIDGKMLPIKKHGIYSMSIGYLIEEEKAVIWRGPMVSKALYQLLVGVQWPKLDYLIVDMPPGTGDIYLSLAENFVIHGVALLCTPQQIALSMVKKSISFFNKVNIPIIGIIENMSYFIDANNNIQHIFGNNLTEEGIKDLRIELLGRIPLVPKISQFSDQGMSLLKEEEFDVYKEIVFKLID